MIIIDLAVMTTNIEYLLNGHILLSQISFQLAPLAVHIKLNPRSRKRSSSCNNSSFRRYKSPYPFPSQPRNDRKRSRSHSKSKPYSNYQNKPTFNLTQQPPSLIPPSSLH